MLYRYDRYGEFPQQQAQLISIGTEMVANSQDWIYPFFVIEFKGDRPAQLLHAECQELLASGS
jgi:hypothetical protein